MAEIKINNIYEQYYDVYNSDLNSNFIIQPPGNLVSDYEIISVDKDNYGKSFKKLVDDLIDGEVTLYTDSTSSIEISEKLSTDDFSGLTLSNFARRTEKFWSYILTHMNNIINNNGLSHWGIRQSDFPHEDSQGNDIISVIEYINSCSDLSELLLNNYINKIGTDINEHNQYWNESVAELIGLYKDFLKNDTTIDSTDISISDMKNADAGNSFNNSEWVRPWRNIDNKNYAQVRNNDKIKRILNNLDSLQYTKKKRTDVEKIIDFEQYNDDISISINNTVVNQIYDYIRLLMPEYERSLEIEDLNRNFWVIGQVLTGLCSFLFDDDSPLNDIFNRIFDELSQLWENMFHLWLTTKGDAKRSYDNIQSFFMPVSTYEMKPYLKYDGFCTYTCKKGLNNQNIADTADLFWAMDSLITPEKIVEYFKKNNYSHGQWQSILLKQYFDLYFDYIKDRYNGSAIAITPEFRLNNYFKNYYSQSAYFGTIIYDESLPMDRRVQFFIFSEPIIIDLAKYNNDKTFSYSKVYIGEKERTFNLLGLKEYDEKYEFAYPREDNYLTFISLLRPNFSIQLKKENDVYSPTKIKLSFTDVAAEIAELQNNERLVFEYSFSENKGSIAQYPNLTEIKLIFTKNDLFDNSPPEEDPEVVDKTIGFYRGELISWFLNKKKIEDVTSEFSIKISYNWFNTEYYVPDSDFDNETKIRIKQIKYDNDETFIEEYEIKMEKGNGIFIKEKLPVMYKDNEGNYRYYQYYVEEKSMKGWKSSVFVKENQDNNIIIGEDGIVKEVVVKNTFIGDGIANELDIIEYPIIPENLLDYVDLYEDSEDRSNYIKGQYEDNSDDEMSFDNTTLENFKIRQINNKITTDFLGGQTLSALSVNKNMDYFNNIQLEEHRQLVKIGVPNILIPQIYSIKEKQQNDRDFESFFVKPLKTSIHNFYPKIKNNVSEIALDRLKGFINTHLVFKTEEGGTISDRIYMPSLKLNWREPESDNFLSFGNPVVKYQTELYIKKNNTSLKKDNWCARLTIMQGYMIKQLSLNFIEKNGVYLWNENIQKDKLMAMTFTDIYSILFFDNLDNDSDDEVNSINGTKYEMFGLHLQRQIDNDKFVYLNDDQSNIGGIFIPTDLMSYWETNSDNEPFKPNSVFQRHQNYLEVNKKLMEKYELYSNPKGNSLFYKYPRTGKNIFVNSDGNIKNERNYCPET